MRINYKGMDKEYNYRIAEICYDEENEKEQKNSGIYVSINVMQYVRCSTSGRFIGIC